jgi:DNA polymerase-1
VQKVKLTEFNPGSRDHIATWLQRGFGWEPMEFTKDGKPKCDETTLNDLPWPEAKVLVQYLTVAKRLGQLYEGDESWFKHEHNGRIHGGVNTNGAVTGRMTHAGPNMAQVPACSALYGKECRALFTASPGMVLVGIDADALELRDLAGYMAKFDGGEYIRTVLEGKKEDGTDMHSVNCRALGMQPKEKQWDGRPGREVAKTWFYAFIYGAGDEKLGFIRTGQKGPEAVRAGKKARKAFLTGLPALGKLVEQVKKVSQERGYLLGLDGRRLNVRGQHSALNTLLQSAGAVQMKIALTILDRDLQAAGLVPGVDYEFVANVHDEWQIECKPELGEKIGELGKAAIRKAGEQLGFRCPLDGAYSVGRTWADTH